MQKCATCLKQRRLTVVRRAMRLFTILIIRLITSA